MREFVCIVCPMGCRLRAEEKEGKIEVSGNTCRRGEEFALRELTNPTRSLTTTVRTGSPELPMLPVRTDGEIPKGRIFEVMEALRGVVVAPPIKCGDTVVKNILDTGVDIIATLTIER